MLKKPVEQSTDPMVIICSITNKLLHIMMLYNQVFISPSILQLN